MSDSETELAASAVDNENVSDNVPKSDPEAWKGADTTTGSELGDAASEAAFEEGAGELDLDHLNDNLQEGFDDNLSLEVNFGDGSSCRASDDRPSEAEGATPTMPSVPSRASGAESRDASPRDSAQTPSDAGDTTPTASETLRSNSSNGNQSDASLDAMTPDRVVAGGGIAGMGGGGGGSGVAGTGGGAGGSGVQKRNSLEIRNNIPNTKEVKKCANDLGDDRPKLQGVGGLPKMRKKSPGLARRLADSVPVQGLDRDSSSSERESEPAQIDTTVHSAQKDFELKLQQTKMLTANQEQTADAGEANTKRLTNGKSDSFEKLCDSLLGNDSQNYAPSSGDCNTSPEDGEQFEDQVKGMEIENEYDYIKYARIQHGNSYVGMRLAYSTSSDSLSAKRNNWSGGGMRTSDDDYLASSYDGSPEKLSLHQPRISGQIHMSKVNEDTLTEIPLNGSDQLCPDDKNFSLSPEATECDSAEVESVISEEGKSSTSGMPIVEDGLSSSQGSDVEDVSTHDAQEQTPSEILKRRYKAEIDQGLQTGDTPAPAKVSDEMPAADNSASAHSTPSHTSGTSCTSTLESQRNKEVDMAIKDIKSAIERSKQAARQRAAQASDDTNNQEPVWVMRDSYVKKLGHHNDLQHVREEYQRQQNEEQGKQKQDQDFQADGDDDDAIKYPYHNDTKTFPSNKGFDSDDEIAESDRAFSERSRHVKGRQYKALPAEEPVGTGSGLSDVSRLSNGGQSASRVVGPSWRGSRGEMPSDRAGVQRAVSPPSQGAPKLSSFGSEDPAKAVPSFTAALPNSRYQPSSTSQYSESLSSSSQNAIYQRCSSSQSQSVPQSHMTGSVSSQQIGGSTYRPSPSSVLAGQNLTSDVTHERRSSDPERSPYVDSEHSASGELSSSGDGQRRRRRRRPSYEYHDDSEEDYYDDEDGNPTAYIRDREHGGDYDTDEETDELLDKQYTRSEKVDIPELSRPPVNRSAQVEKRRTRVREVTLRDPENETVLIEGVLFRARYLGSTQLLSDGQPSKALRMMQAQEAVGRIKAPEGENQPSTEVDLFVSIEKIMVLNTDLQEIMMDHALRTISYIADIGDILVIMARRGPVMSPSNEGRLAKRKHKICCHVFETDEAQLIAQSIGQAFQVAYMEFLKANGIENPGILKEVDYQDVLNQQEIFGEELFLFSNKEMQKEVIVPKLKNEPLGVVIVESGWGSMVPTVVLANMSPNGAAARCGQLNIGDQIMSINGVSLVGIPLSSCQTYIKACRNQTAVKLNVVSCAPVVEVCIKRPDVKYQLGFSVQNGVICSLLRGGIAERGGVRVGHRIIEINGESVVAVPHEKIVKMLATSVGEIHMKTMPTSIFRLLTGQDTPHYI